MNNYRKRIFARAVNDAGLDLALTPHDLRDTATTIAFANGATVKAVQRMLGHSKASITLDRYTGVLESMTERTDERFEAAFRDVTADRAAFLRTSAQQPRRSLARSVRPLRLWGFDEQRCVVWLEELA